MISLGPLWDHGPKIPEHPEGTTTHMSLYQTISTIALYTTEIVAEEAFCKIFKKWALGRPWTQHS